MVLLLIGGICLISIGVVLVSWAFMFESYRKLPISFLEKPTGCSDSHVLSFVSGSACTLVGIVLLFVHRWWAGIIGIAAGYVGIRVVHKLLFAWTAWANMSARGRMRRQDEARCRGDDES